MAKDKVEVPNELGQLQALMGLIGGGGQTATTTPTNTAPLQNVLSQLQGIDYNAMLQAIFQQAAGQIPGLQSAYGRAVGARSSGNAPMQAALQSLLQQTTLAGQQQVANQQLQNAQIQAQAGQGIASATKGTTQKTTQNSQLGQLAAMIGLLQGATKLGGYKTVQDMMRSVTGMGTGTQTPAGDAFLPGALAPMSGTADNAPFDLTAYINTAAPVDESFTPFQDSAVNYTPVPELPAFNVADYAVDNPEMSMAPEEWFQQPNAMQWF